ncbi:hypothetical protein TNCV_3823651 [Trichonephila clavipes]|nr:hypothetical protein TNCV_3823651 [Trichonephila clavipes]
MTSRHSCTRFIVDHTIEDASVCDAASKNLEITLQISKLQVGRKETTKNKEAWLSLDSVLEQGCPTCVPRAACDPPIQCLTNHHQHQKVCDYSRNFRGHISIQLTKISRKSKG